MSNLNQTVNDFADYILQTPEFTETTGVVQTVIIEGNEILMKNSSIYRYN